MSKGHGKLQRRILEILESDPRGSSIWYLTSKIFDIGKIQWEDRWRYSTHEGSVRRAVRKLVREGLLCLKVSTNRARKIVRLVKHLNAEERDLYDRLGIVRTEKQDLEHAEFERIIARLKERKIAEEQSGFLGMDEVDQADQTLEIDKTEEMIGALASQQRLALVACCMGLKSQQKTLTTGHAYKFYMDVCSRSGVRALTQRRFSDMVSFLDLYGLVNARVISKGRYGKTRELSSALPESIVSSVLAPHV